MQTELKGTALAVRQWRKENSGPMTGLAVDLQRRVVRLLEEHSWDEVCDAVGINKSQLAIWRRDHREHLQLRSRRVSRQRTKRPPPKGARMRPAPGFIELPITTEPRRDIEVRLPTGVVVCAGGNADLGAVGELVARLLTQGAA